MKRTTLSERGLILAPHGRDAAIAGAILGEAAIERSICRSALDLIAELDRGAGFAVITEEALATADLKPLGRWLGEQEDWSDFPFVLLTSAGGGLERNPQAQRYLGLLGNVTFLERPFHPTTLVSLANAALRGRRRQYEARRRLQELRESEARFEAITNSIDQMVWSTTPDGYHDFYNQRWYEFTGATPGSTDGQRWSGMFHPDDQERSWQRWSHSLATGEPYQIEYRLRHHTGEYRWVLGRAQCMRDPAGAIVRWFGTCTDIQEIVEAREVLARSRDDLEEEIATRTRERNRVWEMSKDMFAVMALDGYLKVINPAWSVILGFDQATLMANPVAEQVHPDDLAPTLEIVARLAKGEVVDRFENRLRHADGGWRSIVWSLVPEGEVFYAVGRDVTADRTAAAELEMAQSALRQSQKMEAIGQLTGGVAHDFNNLLTPIVACLDILQRRGVGSEREKPLIVGAAQAADRAATLVQRLLAFARRQPLQASPVDLARLVRDMADLVASTTGPQIEVVVEVAEPLPPALADPNQLEMALLNLSVNARDAMPAGGTLRIAAQAEPAQRTGWLKRQQPGFVRLSVADTGIGMDAATVAQAVEPFFSTKGVGKGTGLGLSMVHGLVAQLGGRMEITSAPGAGTTIHLLLPVAGRNAKVRGGPKADTAVASAAGTALLVDDEPLVRATTADLLDELGFAVVEADSAEAALQLIDKGLRPDLIVTDHLMPGMSGTELARRVQGSMAEARVLLISGYAELDDLAPDLPRLAKPFRRSELSKAIGELTRG